MNIVELGKFKMILEAQRTELGGALRNREDIAIEKAPDTLDQVQLAGERELAIRNLHRESNLLKQVCGAMARLADGSFGMCMHCGEEISMKRLNAVPQTAFCIRCQEAADRHESKEREALDGLVAGAEQN